MLSLFLPSHTLSRLAAVALLGVVFAWNTTFAEETPLVIDESPALEVQNVENTPLDVAEILPEVVPEEVISDIIIPESTVVVLVIGADIPFADTPALEPEVLPESLNIPLL